MPKKKVVRGEGETRKRIVEVATRHFADASYDDVALRTIAAEVGVDVSYVHHSFGSKEQLFLAVLDAADSDPDLSGVNPDDLARHIAGRLLGRRRSQQEEIDQLFLLIRSLTNRKTSRVIAERLESYRIGPLRDKLGDDKPFRAGLVMSLSVGFIILQNLLLLPAVTDVDPDEAEELVTRALEGIISYTKPSGDEPA